MNWIFFGIALFFDTALLVSMAFAEGEAPAQASPSFLEVLILPLGLLAIMYFMIIRPQSKRNKEHRELLQNLKVGEEVVTTGGIIGRIKAVADTFVTLEVAAGVSVKVVTNNVSGYTKKPPNQT